MFTVLRHRTFRRLFLAQVVALVGTGLATVALALLAYDIAGASAGEVLGTALAIKMIVYVLLAPVSAAVVPPRLRKPVLIGLDVVRAAVVLALPFVTEVWHIYVLIALLQSASASFTPLFQSLIPEILPNERDYTAALSLSRLAYDLESLLSPALAAALLVATPFSGLFVGTSVGFAMSAALVLSTTFPSATSDVDSVGPYSRALRGMRVYLRTPRLRGLLAMNLCAAAGGAMVFVNTVVIVRGELGGHDTDVAWALASFGFGSMSVAVLLPRLLDHISDRDLMLGSGLAMGIALLLGTGAWWAGGGKPAWAWLIPLWIAMGMGYSGLITPGGRLIRRSAEPENLPFLFASQFSLSHACWLLTYAIAGWVGARLGLGTALGILAVLCWMAWLFARSTWAAGDTEVITHRHDNLGPDHPHVREHARPDGSHAHRFFIDDIHTRWPK